MNIDREGRFKGFIIENSIDLKETGALQFVARFRVAQYFDESTGEWVDFSEYDMESVTYVNLVKKDGDLNTRNIDSLKAALGWDATSFDGLTADFSQICVQATVGAETYEGKTSLRIQWINPEDYEGQGLKKIDAAALQSVKSKFDGKLRMLNGTKKPATAPKPAAPAADANPLPEVAEVATAAAPAAPKAPQPRPTPPPRKPL